MKPFIFGPEEAVTSGVITFADYRMMADGRRYIAAWSPRWEIIADKDMPMKLRSAEGWFAAAVVGGNVVLILPGCQVKSWSYCTNMPEKMEIEIYKV